MKILTALFVTILYINPVLSDDTADMPAEGDSPPTTSDTEWWEIAIEGGKQVLKLVSGSITRSCESSYIIDYNGDKTSFGTFKATRGCGGLVPNRCRRRARDAAHECMQKHWEDKEKSITPLLCQINGVKEYNIKSLTEEVTKSICLKSDSGQSKLVSIIGVTSGNKGCGPREKKRQEKQLGQLEVSCP